MRRERSRLRSGGGVSSPLPAPGFATVPEPPAVLFGWAPGAAAADLEAAACVAGVGALLPHAALNRRQPRRTRVRAGRLCPSCIIARASMRTSVRSSVGGGHELVVHEAVPLVPALFA